MSATASPIPETLPAFNVAEAAAFQSGYDANRDNLAMLRLTVFTAALAAGLIFVRGLRFPPADATGPTSICLCLSALAWFYHRVRPAANFVLVLKSLLALVAFSTCYTLLMYALATTARPLADAVLAECDARLHISAETVIRWVDARPALAWAMQVIYLSLIPQTILLIGVLGLTNDRRHLDRFLVRFMLGSLVSLIGFYLLPAVGTCASFDVGVPGLHVPFTEHFSALRDGSRTLITWRDAEGLITFPSFHAIWAVFLAAAFYRRRWLFFPVALLNLAVIASTITTGMHYATDMLAGVVIALLIIAATRLPPASR